MKVASVGSAGPSIAGMPRHAKATSAIRTIETTVTSRAVCVGKKAVGGPGRGRTGPEMPFRRMRIRCAAMIAIRIAGRKITCAAYQRVRVSAPIAAPPCMIPATISPATGASFEILIVTTVAQ